MAHTYLTEQHRDNLPLQIERQMLDHWLPIVGDSGYAIWSMYALFKQVSIRRMARHLGMAIKTVQIKNEVLIVCNLIKITSGDRTHSNHVKVFSPKVITPEILTALRGAIASSELLNKGYASHERIRLLDEIGAWQPFEEIVVPTLDQPKSEPMTTHPNGVYPLDTMLLGIGIGKKAIKSILGEIGDDTERARGWLEHIKQSSNITNPAGFFRHVIREGQPVPTPNGAEQSLTCVYCDNGVPSSGSVCEDCKNEMGIIS